MSRGRWIVAGVAVVLVSAVAFLAANTGGLVQRIRDRISSSGPSETQRESKLLADAFNSKVEKPYRPLRKGELEFHKQIAPIVYEKCARCHNAGGSAPFQLTSYEEVRKRARRIQQVVSRRLMPPWMPDRCSPELVGDLSLTNEEKGKLEQWLAEGCREGNQNEAISAPQSAAEWAGGTPDAILQPLEPYKIPAEGPDIYRSFIIPTNYNEDRYVRMADVMPGARKVVHHVLLFVDPARAGRKLQDAEPGPGFSGLAGAFGKGEIGIWVPGKRPVPLPEGIGSILPKGADVLVQVHYHPDGKEETDLSRVALYFCDKPVNKRMRVMPILVPPKSLRLPAGDNNAVFWAEQEMPGDISVIQVFPHMHLLGREIAAAATLPDGSVVPILSISNWDFRWQNSYTFKTPIRLPRGSRVRFEAKFDNSSDNPRNPNHPPKFVHSGLRTTDEMCLFYFLYTLDEENLTRNESAPGKYPDGFLQFGWSPPIGGRK